MSAARSRKEKLTVYAIREKVGGQRVTGFDQVVRPDMLASPEVQPHDVPGGSDFDARFYLMVGPPTPPSFAGFLGAVEGIKWPTRNAVGGLLVVRLRGDGDYFALTFENSGKRLLREDAFERGYGLKVALNVICEDLDAHEVELRQITMRRVSRFVLDTRSQTNIPAPFEVFGLDPQQDLLRGVVGPPSHEDQWGHQIEGSDSVQVQLALNLNGMGWLCQAIRRMHQRLDYKRVFPWVDDVEAVKDSKDRSNLEAVLCERVRLGSKSLVLAPPEVLEWNRIDQFRMVVGRHHHEGTALQLQDYLDLLERDGKRAQLDMAMLRRHRVEALDAHGGLAYPPWSVLRCLDGEVRVGTGDDETTWFVSNGEFYKVALSFIQGLNQELARVPVSKLAFPAYQPGDDEGAYNESAAAGSEMLLLDKRLVQVEGKGPVELCDLLTQNAGAFVHVKRHFHSSTLSHLFSQGAVAAELLVENVEFQRKVAARVREAEQEQSRKSGDAACVGKYSEVFANGYSPHSRDVVFAIIGEWKGHDLAGRLPFFSKMNLRAHASRIRTVGYTVAYAPIEAKYSRQK